MIGKWLGAYLGHWLGFGGSEAVQHVPSIIYEAVAHDFDEQLKRRDFDEAKLAQIDITSPIDTRTAVRYPNQITHSKVRQRTATRVCNTHYADRKR